MSLRCTTDHLLKKLRKKEKESPPLAQHIKKKKKTQKEGTKHEHDMNMTVYHRLTVENSVVVCQTSTTRPPHACVGQQGALWPLQLKLVLLSGRQQELFYIESVTP